MHRRFAQNSWTGPHREKLLYKQFTMKTNDPAPPNRCGYCGATSYRRVLGRDLNGVMRYTAQLLCSGCSREFADMTAWRRGAVSEQTLPEAQRTGSP